MFEVMQAQAGTVSHFDYNSRELILLNFSLTLLFPGCCYLP